MVCRYEEMGVHVEKETLIKAIIVILPTAVHKV